MLDVHVHRGSLLLALIVVVPYSSAQLDKGDSAMHIDASTILPEASLPTALRSQGVVRLACTGI